MAIWTSNSRKLTALNNKLLPHRGEGVDEGACFEAGAAVGLVRGDVVSITLVPVFLFPAALTDVLYRRLTLMLATKLRKDIKIALWLCPKKGMPRANVST